MPTFFARRYARRVEAVGNVEKTVGILILLLTAGIVAIYAFQALTNRNYLFDEGLADQTRSAARDRPDDTRSRDVAEHAEEVFPEPGVTGWSAPSRAQRFTPDDLYVKIDGRAEAYLQHHVAGLVFGTYSHATAPDRTIDVYWYDMGAPADALAMYQSERPPDVSPVSIGEAGYQASGAVFFRSGSAYIQVLPSSQDEADGQAALAIAQRIAAQLADQAEER